MRKSTGTTWLSYTYLHILGKDTGQYRMSSTSRRYRAISTIHNISDKATADWTQNTTVFKSY